ncbi:hypothetical protein DAI22_06g285300 [Oryza sativa Japonica Group]|nr:hypothetical protein DAI22_06g285300 [Oryza sativa Japonica Group]
MNTFSYLFNSISMQYPVQFFSPSAIQKFRSGYHALILFQSVVVFVIFEGQMGLSLVSIHLSFTSY